MYLINCRVETICFIADSEREIRVMSTMRNTNGIQMRARRVYNRSDKLIEAMLGAGLEYLITSGFYMEEFITSPKSSAISTASRDTRRQFTKQSDYSKQQDTPEESSALAKIMEELYQLEEEYKRTV